MLAMFALPNTVSARVTTEPGSHLIYHNGHSSIIVGDSGTQCVMQNLNIDYRSWIDDCAASGQNAIHIWSFMAPRQTQDGKIVESRYGYVYPGITPWARQPDGAAARDGLPQWNLQEFDEGDDPRQHYWPRLRDLCGYAKKKKLLVGITVFFGWPKHQSDWVWHPFNRANGGHLTDHRSIIEATQQIATPGVEIFGEPWSDLWSASQKTQWLWEQFAAKILKETQPFGNTFYVFMDERSYSEGNCADHFARFFRRRGAYWIDGDIRRDRVDAVVAGHGPGRNINRLASKSFDSKPLRPLFEFELPPYRGSDLRHNLYACLLGGGHYLFHNDADQESPTTGIMSYDPIVRNDHRESVIERQRWLGIACLVMNKMVLHPDRLKPSNDLLRLGNGYCMADPGSEYLAYVRSGGKATLQLDGSVDDYDVRLISPRDGKTRTPTLHMDDESLRIDLPNDQEWLILAQRRKERSVSHPLTFKHHFGDRNNVPRDAMGQTDLVDVDRDGDLDFITGQRGGTVFWYEYRSADEWVQHRLGDRSPSDVGGTAVDVNRDGWTDFVVGGVWYENMHKPREQLFRRHIFDSRLRAVHDVIAGDLNGDGQPEVLTMSDQSDLRWYLIPEDATKPWVPTRIGESTHSGISLGDLDADGDLDVVRSNVWFENHDEGTRWSLHRLTEPWGRTDGQRWERNATQTRTADINNDGRVDVVITDGESRGARIAWIEAPKNPRSDSWMTHLLPHGDKGARGAFHSLAIADFNQDGKLDIFTVETEVVPGARSPRWFIWEALDGQGSFSERIILDANLGGHEAVIGDVDGDGDIDICSKLWRPQRNNANKGRNHFDYLENQIR